MKKKQTTEVKAPLHACAGDQQDDEEREREKKKG